MTQQLEATIRSIIDGHTYRHEELYLLLLTEELYVAIENPIDSPQPGPVGVKVLCAADTDGAIAAGVFTSEEALTRWNPAPCHYVRAKGAQIFMMFSRMPVERVHVNWGSTESVTLSRAEVEALAQGQTNVTEGQPVDLSTLDEVNICRPKAPLPPHSVGALRQIVQSQPRIAFAYLPQIRYSRQQSVNGTLVLVLVPTRGVTETQIEDLLNSISLKAQEVLPAGQPMDIMTLPLEHELLALVMQTKCVLAVNDQDLHRRALDVLQRVWEQAA